VNEIAIDPALLAEAERLSVDVARAAAKGIADAVELARSTQWREENRDALESSNAYVEKNGLPLASQRLF
jgi:antitoxin CcdA